MMPNDTYEYTPHLLTPSEYHRVGELMLRPMHSNHRTAERILHEAEPLEPISKHENFAFFRQLSNTLFWPAIVHSSLHRPTDVFVAAHEDAVPLLDAARAFMAHHEVSNTDALHISQLRPNNMRKYDHVTLLEPYAVDTAAIREAAEHIRNLGTSSISIVRGMYYRNVASDDINVESGSSSHTAFMSALSNVYVAR